MLAGSFYDRRLKLRGFQLWYLLILFSLSGCSAAYHFQYHYTMVSPPGGTEGVENDQVRIHLIPEPTTGIIQLDVTNKNPRPIMIAWEQTHYIDPLGRRRQATETGVQWFLRPREWIADNTRISPGETLQIRVHPGTHQTYNPFAVTSTAGEGMTLSSSPRPLLPPAGDTPTAGQRYAGQEFRFILALRIDTDVIQYPFTFRVTGVDVR
jgi:hypothetical protein